MFVATRRTCSTTSASATSVKLPGRHCWQRLRLDATSAGESLGRAARTCGGESRAGRASLYEVKKSEDLPYRVVRARATLRTRFAVLQASDVDRHGEKNLQGVSTRPPKKPGEQLGVLVMTWTTDHLTSPRSVACRPRPAPLARYSMASARSRSAFQSSSELAKATPALAPTCSD